MNYKNKAINYLCITFALLSLIVSFLLIRINGIGDNDLKYYWQNSAYAIRGYNLEWVYANQFTIDSIGSMQGIGILSYARILSNLIIPGFIPYYYSHLYYIFLNTFTFFLLGYHISLWLKEKHYCKGKIETTLVSISLLLIPWIWAGYLRWQNIGGLLALLTTLSVFYIEDHENIAALLLACSLIKPQIGAIYLFALFLKKNYRLITKIIAILFTSEVIYLIYVHIMNNTRNLKIANLMSDVIKIYNGYAGNDAEAERGVTWFLYYGIFNMLKDFGVPIFIVLLLSMLAGISFVYILMKKIQHTPDLYQDYIIIWGIASIASLFWFYKSDCDSLVLIICNLIIFYYYSSNSSKKSTLLIISFFLVGLNCLVGRYIMRFGLGLINYEQGILLDQLLQIIFYTYLLFKCQPNSSIEI